MSNWFVIFILLFTLGALLLLVDIWMLSKNIKSSERFGQIFHHQHKRKVNTPVFLLRWGLKSGLVENSEFNKLLIQAGWESRFARISFWFVGRILPFIAAVFTFIIAIGVGSNVANALFKAIFAFSLFFVGTNMVLRWRASVVTKAIVKELIPFLHMLRMLFNAGLSLEHSLIILVEQSSSLFPHFSKQLRRVLLNLNAGQDQADALMNMAKTLDIHEVTDAVSIIHQVSKYGGNVQASLSSYVELIEVRQFSTLREYVSKLSAKMSIVMILFMFPALIIFIAGPGFVGIADALSGNLL